MATAISEATCSRDEVPLRERASGVGLQKSLEAPRDLRVCELETAMRPRLEFVSVSGSSSGSGTGLRLGSRLTLRATPLPDRAGRRAARAATRPPSLRQRAHPPHPRTSTDRALRPETATGPRTAPPTRCPEAHREAGHDQHANAAHDEPHETSWLRAERHAKTDLALTRAHGLRAGRGLRPAASPECGPPRITVPRAGCSGSRGRNWSDRTSA
jgi:hypothetical protein